MRRVRVGVIGAGGIAQIEHIPNLIQLKDASRSSASTIRRRRCGPSSARRWAGGIRDLDALLAQPLDAVVIASPDALHQAQMLAAFPGLHVFCEKPLCYASRTSTR